MPDSPIIPPPMAGTLARYGPLPHQLAFLSSAASPPSWSSSPPPPHPSKQRLVHVVLLAGLTEGLLALPYADLLARRCIYESSSSSASEKSGGVTFQLVQAQLKSSYDGWGMACLDDDADEVVSLMLFLRNEHGSAGVVIVGHSTGAQIACRVCEKHHAVLRDAYLEAEAAAAGRGGAGGPAAAAAAAATFAAMRLRDPQQMILPPPLLAVCLQGAVSDREYFFAHDPRAADEQLADARRAVNIANDGSRIVAVVEGSALSARRAIALLAQRGDDEMFSRDLSSEVLKYETSVGWLCGRDRKRELERKRCNGDDDRDEDREEDDDDDASLAPPPRPVLVLASGADEYVPPLLPPPPPPGPSERATVEAEAYTRARKTKLEEIRAHAELVASAAGEGATAVTIEKAPHNGGAGDEARAVVDAIAGLLRRAAAYLP